MDDKFFEELEDLLEKMAILIKARRVGTSAPPGLTWTPAQKGDAAGSIVENSSSSLTITARGTSDTTVDIDYAYQEVESGDIQITARIPDSITGTPENYSQFGVGISEGDEATDWFAHCFWAYIGRVIRKSGVSGSVTSANGLQDQSLARYVGLTYDDTAEEITAWESSNGTDWFIVGEPVSRELTYPVRVYAYGCSHDQFNELTVTVDNITLGSTITLEDATEPPPAVGPRNVHFLMDFETGEFQPNGELHDGGFVQTLPHPQTDRETASSGSGGFGPDDDATDTQVVETFTFPVTGNGGGSEVVTPRGGDYFCKMTVYQTKYTNDSNGNQVRNPAHFPTLHYDQKDYRDLANGSIRNEISNSDNRIEFGRDVYVGYSWRFPANWETETLANETHGTRMLAEVGTQASNDMWEFKVHTVGGQSMFACDYVTGSGRQEYDFGPLSDWNGQWVDVVVLAHAAMNSNGKFIVWVSDPESTPDSNGNRAMIQHVNHTGATGPQPSSQDIHHRMKLYCPGWGGASVGTAQTNVVGPISVCIDEHSWGYVDEGTTFSDVHPGRKVSPT